MFMKILNENKLLSLSSSYIFKHALVLLKHSMLSSSFSHFLANPTVVNTQFRSKSKISS